MPKAYEEKFNLIPIIETTLDLYKEAHIQTTFIEKCDGKAYIIADKDHILRAFNNLVKNAIQAIPEGDGGTINVSLTTGDSNFLIEIKDNGIGISEEQKDKIFVPNFTTKSTGMGLGLAMVKNSIENANGSIWFTTEENKGTSFYVELPKA
jgi:signal transduction histidine kinase